MGTFTDITGNTYGNWVVDRYAGKSHWECTCKNCGEHKTIIGYKLKTMTPRCSCELKINIGTKIDDLTVIDVQGTQDYTCTCKCGRTVKLKKYDLTHHRNTVCGHKDKRDLTGQTFGEWTVLKHLEGRMWLCRCSCGKEKPVLDYSLTSGRSNSCGHPKADGFDVKPGAKINSWEVIKSLGHGKWLCRCECGKEGIVNVSSLRYGYSKSCGCKNGELRRETMLKRYGEVTSNKIESNKREEWQIEAVTSKESFKSYLLDFEKQAQRKPRVQELTDILGMQKPALLKNIHKFELEEFVDFLGNVSFKEIELRQFIQSIYNGAIEFNNKKILNGYEIDIYIPELKLAIEFNGTYWHNSLFKDRKYHLNKTLGCLKNGIRLIHIFEYEWDNANDKEKIMAYLKSIICRNRLNTIYARNTEVRVIDNSEAIEFCNKYHLQSGVNSKINIGEFYNSELVGVMTFGNSRFDESNSVELYRLAFKSDVTVIGGASKMFKFFVDNFKASKVVTYCDIAKFTGNIYTKLGFITSIKNLSRPNYVWVKDNVVLSRYETQKHRLINLGIGDQDQNEDTIMSNNGFLKIYDCGNLKLIWECNK